MLAGAGMSFSSVVVFSNGLRLRRFRPLNPRWGGVDLRQ